MTDILWGSDCCQCRLIMEIRLPSPTFVFIDWIQKCDIHKGFDNQALLNVVSAHNKLFQLTLPNPTAQEKAQNQIDKRNERVRILALGDPVKNV